MSSGRGERRTNGRVLVLHEHGGRVHALCAHGAGESVEVEWEESCPAQDGSHVRRLLRRAKGAAVVEVVPGAACVCRAVADPGGIARLTGSESAAALALLAESELGSAMPPYRRGAGVVSLGRDRARRACVVVSAWPERAEARPSHTPGSTFIAEAGAWSVLAGRADIEALGVIDTGADHSAGAYAVVVAGGPSGAKVRAMPIEARAAGEEAIRETRAGVGLDSGSEPPDSTSAAEGRDVRVWGSITLPGRGRSGAWLAAYGAALGAAMAALDTSGRLNPLASMREQAAPERPSARDRCVGLVSTPAKAGMVLVVCALVVMLWPLAIAAGRNVILEARAGGSPDEVEERLAEREDAHAKYESLKVVRWPMTKLLSDVAGAAPVGVIVESIELRVGDGVTVTGSAESVGQVTQLLSNMEGSGVFTGVNRPNLRTEDGRERFTVRAKLRAPRYRAKPAEDFSGDGALAVRRGWADHDEAVSRMGSSGSSSSSRGPSRTTTSRRPTGSSDSGRTTVRPGDARGAEAEIPPVLTDEDLAAMTQQEAMIAWTSRQSASRKVEDPEVKERLANEAERAKARFLELKSGGG